MAAVSHSAASPAAGWCDLFFIAVLTALRRRHTAWTSSAWSAAGCLVASCVFFAVAGGGSTATVAAGDFETGACAGTWATVHSDSDGVRFLVIGEFELEDIVLVELLCCFFNVF